MSSHPLTITPASFNASAPVIRIAAGVSSPLARRDGGGPACVVLRLAQFRSAALGGASLIAGLARVGARICVTVGARIERVFAELKMIDRRSLHDGPTIALECLPCPTTDMSISTREVLPAS